MNGYLPRRNLHFRTKSIILMLTMSKKNINGINVENAFFISSVTGFNIDSLCRKVNEMINNDKEKDDDNFDQKSSTWEP